MVYVKSQKSNLNRKKKVNVQKLSQFCKIDSTSEYLHYVFYFNEKCL